MDQHKIFIDYSGFIMLGNLWNSGKFLDINYYTDSIVTLLNDRKILFYLLITS